MSDSELCNQDLEAFQRWAIVVDDQLRDAVNAMLALEDPDAEPLRAREDVLASDVSSADLSSDLIEEINGSKENQDRPAWFTPAFQMVLAVSTRATFLMDYVDEVTCDGRQPNEKQFTLIVERIQPAIEHFDRFLRAVKAAGYLSN
jgi:hypothetical protein